MIAIPAVDLREGACVQLVGGSYAQERVRLDDPVRVATRWAHCGFTNLHVVDLDAATNRGSNADLVRAILQGSDAVVQVGGGVRTTSQVENLFSAGARRVVVGTRAIEEPDWIAELATSFPQSIVLAADVRQRKVVTKGWTATSGREISSLLEQVSQLPLAGILVTAVHREGSMKGADLRLMEDVVRLATVPVFASGGIASRRDLDDLRDAGVAGAILGMALYTGALDPCLIAEEYSA
jgi:phosphoribosylformimino-5-aminoimidazole carboxamide ribotide isomerase